MTPAEDAALKALMVAAQAGDQDAYETLLKEVAQLVRRFVQFRAPRAGFGEDVVQECLLTVHRGRRTYDPSRAFGPWLHAIAECRLIDAFRREGRMAKRIVADEELLATFPDPASNPEPGGREGLADELRAALDALPDTQREVIELMKVDGLSVREVAGATGLSEANVRVIAHRGYKALRRRLEGWRR
jgi:RNA polymerase sigma-70 factor (ECF subfamily)